MRSGLYAIGILSEENTIEVGFHDLLFAKLVINLIGQINLLNFTLPVHIAIQEYITCQLHRDGGSTAQIAGAEEIADGSGNAVEIYAVMAGKAFIFGADKGVDKIFWNLIIRNYFAVLRGFDLLNQISFGIHNLGIFF